MRSKNASAEWPHGGGSCDSICLQAGFGYRYPLTAWPDRRGAYPGGLVFRLVRVEAAVAPGLGSSFSIARHFHPPPLKTKQIKHMFQTVPNLRAPVPKSLSTRARTRTHAPAQRQPPEPC